MSASDPVCDGNVLLKAITEQSERLRAAQKTHGEFHAHVSDDLKQLSLLFVMNGEHDKALPLLHQRLVIHEKFGPDDLTAETLQELGTVYRLHGLPDIAVQHLLRALTLREKFHGKNSLKVAETLNSLALVSQMQGEMEQAETYQLRSLQVLYDSAEPEDIESEDIPWEVYKRLKQQRGPSTAANSITLLKGNMRKSVMDVVYKSPGSLSPTEEPTRSDKSETLGLNKNTKTDTVPRDQMAADVDRRRVLRSHSETTMQPSRGLHTSGSSSDRVPFAHSESEDDRQETDFDPLAQSRISLAPSQSLRSFRPRRDASAGNSAALLTTDEETSLRMSSAVPIAQSIRDFPTLQQRVETLKRRILAGYPDANANVARLAADVDRIQARELREVGSTMVALVREMNRLCIRTDLTQQQQLPVLEGMLEKKSASIFRGWEKRWFKVDPKTFILSYHFSKDDYARGFTPRGGFAVSRISNILVQRHARGNHFHFDVVVDLSTRLNPQGSRTYELRCEDEEALRYWVETLHFYKAMAQKTPPRPSTS